MKNLGLRRFSPAVWIVLAWVAAALTGSHRQGTLWHGLVAFLDRFSFRAFGGFPAAQAYAGHFVRLINIITSPTFVAARHVGHVPRPPRLRRPDHGARRRPYGRGRPARPAPRLDASAPSLDDDRPRRGAGDLGRRAVLAPFPVLRSSRRARCCRSSWPPRSCSSPARAPRPQPSSRRRSIRTKSRGSRSAPTRSRSMRSRSRERRRQPSVVWRRSRSRWSCGWRRSRSPLSFATLASSLPSPRTRSSRSAGRPSSAWRRAWRSGSTACS